MLTRTLSFAARAAVVVLMAGLCPSPASAQAPPDGAALYKARCAACHDNPDGRTPPVESLRNMTPTRILRTLDFGAMMTVAYTLRREEREAVATFLGKPGAEPGPRPETFCSDRHVGLNLSGLTWNGWSPARDNTRFVPGALAKLAAVDVPVLKLKWAFGFEGDISAFAQPTVIGDNVFVGSAGGLVYALSAQSGCARWIFQATGPIRSAIVAAPIDDGHVLLFGDLTGWFYALDAATGRLIWKKRPDEHESVRLSAPPVIHDGLAIIPVASWEESRALNTDYPCCTFRGSLTALRIRDGSEAWKTYMVPAPAERTGTALSGAATFGPSGVAIWGSPTLDLKRRRLYVATGNNYSLPATPMSDSLVAVDLDTGRIVWHSQALANDIYNSACSITPRGPNCPEGSGPDHDFGSPAALVTTPEGRDLLIAGQKSGIVWAFDPDNAGKVVWQTRVGKGGINGGVQWGIASDGQRVYARDVRRCRHANRHRARVGSHSRRRHHGAQHVGRQPRLAYRPAALFGPAQLFTRAVGCAHRDLRPRRSPARSTVTFAPTPPRTVGSSGISTPRVHSRPSTASRPPAARSTAPARSSSTECSSSTRATRGTAARRATCSSRSGHRRDARNPVERSADRDRIAPRWPSPPAPRSDPIASPGSSGRAGWARCTGPTIRGSTATSRSKWRASPFPIASPARRARSPRSTTPTSASSTTSAPTTWSWNSSMARCSRVRWRSTRRCRSSGSSSTASRRRTRRTSSTAI